MTRTGGCLCGAVRYAVSGDPVITIHCHCRMCQKASASAFVTWSTFPKEALAYTQGAPASYRSSPKAVREFCAGCGSPLVFRGDEDANLDVTVVSLDDPDAFAIEANTWCDSRRPWLDGFDFTLPDFDQESPGSMEE